MNNQKTPLHQSGAEGESIKYKTALRIAMNIAIGDAALRETPADQWDREQLYAHLEYAWGFEWKELEEKWEQL